MVVLEENRSALDLKPVVQRSLSHVAADRLRDAIRRGSLAPGAKLVERELADQLGISRIPVREAIQTLVNEGLLRKIPHVGVFTYLPVPVEIEEFCSLRVVLEQFAVERIVARWHPEHEARLRNIVQKMADSIEAGDVFQMYEQDFEFHTALWEIADHSVLYEVVSGLRTRIGGFLYKTAIATPQSSLNIYIEDHNHLIEVFTSRDVAAAKEAIAHHILKSKDRMLAYYDTLS